MNNEPDYDNLYFARKPMTQKIFDTDNAEDMALLWSILPDEVIQIDNLSEDYGEYRLKSDKGESHIECDIILILWHDKKEITRPKNWESMIGCVGWFSSHKDAKKDDMILGLLDKYNKNDNLGRCFYCHCDTWYKYFFPAKKCDVKFYGVDKDE